MSKCKDISKNDLSEGSWNITVVTINATKELIFEKMKDGSLVTRDSRKMVDLTDEVLEKSVDYSR